MLEYHIGDVVRSIGLVRGVSSDLIFNLGFRYLWWVRYWLWVDEVSWHVSVSRGWGGKACCEEVCLVLIVVYLGFRSSFVFDSKGWDSGFASIAYWFLKVLVGCPYVVWGHFLEVVLPVLLLCKQDCLAQAHRMCCFFSSVHCVRCGLSVPCSCMSQLLAC